MEHVLVALKAEMIANKKAVQPADGDMYAWAEADQGRPQQSRPDQLSQGWSAVECKITKGKR